MAQQLATVFAVAEPSRRAVAASTQAQSLSISKPSHFHWKQSRTLSNPRYGLLAFKRRQGQVAGKQATLCQRTLYAQ